MDQACSDGVLRGAGFQPFVVQARGEQLVLLRTMERLAMNWSECCLVFHPHVRTPLFVRTKPSLRWTQVPDLKKKVCGYNPGTLLQSA